MVQEAQRAVVMKWDFQSSNHVTASQHARPEAASQSIPRCCGPNTEPDTVPSANSVSNTWIITTPGLEMLSMPKDSDSFAFCGDHHVWAFPGSPCTCLYNIFTHVYCQRFFATGAQSSYFEVTPGPSGNAAVDPPALQGNAPKAALSREALLHELINMELESSRRALEAGLADCQGAPVATEVDPWLDATRWQQLFKGAPLLNVARLGHMTAPASEPDLCVLTESVDRLVDQAHAAACDDRVGFDQFRINSFVNDDTSQGIEYGETVNPRVKADRQRQREERKATMAEEKIKEGIRSQADPWLELTGWIPHLQGIPRASLLRATQPVGGEIDAYGREEVAFDDTGLRGVCKAMERLIRKAFDSSRAEVVGRLTLEIIERREAGAASNERPFYARHRVSTIKKYSRKLPLTPPHLAERPPFYDPSRIKSSPNYVAQDELFALAEPFQPPAAFMVDEIEQLRQQLRDEQRRREEAETRAAAEQHLREEEQRRREEAEAITLPTTLEEFLQICYKMSLTLKVATSQNPLAGFTHAESSHGMNFRASEQEETWAELSASPAFTTSRVFPSTTQLDYVRSHIDPIDSEDKLRDFAREAAEKLVQMFVAEVVKDSNLRMKLGLRGRMSFQSHTNLRHSSDTKVTEAMQHMSISDASTQAENGDKGKRRHNQKKAASAQSESSRPQRGKGGGRADQFCIYRDNDGQSIPAVAIEYKAPHKLTREEIAAGLSGEIVPDRDVINKEGDSLESSSKWLLAAVVTQCFSYMINRGVQYGYIFTGDAIVFLHIPNDPTTVYYYVSVPEVDVQEDDEHRLHRTAVAQVSTFVIRALAAEPPPQEWHQATLALDTWAVEYMDVLKNIPETDRQKTRETFSYRPSRWIPTARSRVKTRSQCLLIGDRAHVPHNHDGDSGDGYEGRICA
ncbi:hypothetical protein DM02DRAFT_664211 [Periconia macrospinosa]|uniref:Uncharacterized protein n=1 Tax=Periconia macrospinosa TaxID=97972 RepID=A0A2V1CZR8_9PLEO|nr:hypothetical protein DM02DRAFT_664211 [Periconia macrospinosa]